jgi:ABC-2 type transport system permease protein
MNNHSHALNGRYPLGWRAGPAARRLRRVVRHELRLLVSDWTGVVAAVLFGVAVGYGVWNGTEWVAFEQRTIDAAVAAEAKTVANQRQAAAEILAGRAESGGFTDPTNPGVVGGTFGSGRYAVLFPSALAALSIGQSDLRPSYVKVSLQSLQTVLSRDEIENPQTLLLGRFDFAFVVVYLLPLVIIALAYQLLSVEREDGTLALLLSQPVTLGTVLTGKVIARLALLLSVVIGVVLVASLVGGIEVASPGTPGRLLLLAATIVAYAFVWFALAVLVNAAGWPSATNAVVLLATWLALVIVIPATVNIVALRIYPAPSRVELVQALRRATDAADRRAAELLGKFFQDHPELAPSAATAGMSDFYSRTMAVRADADAAIRPVVQRFESQISAQRRFVDRFQFLSPAVLTRGALDDLAGSGEARYQDFVQQIAEHHARWREFFVARIMRQAKVTPADYDRIPVFEYTPEPEQRVRSRVWRSLAGLLVPLAVVVAAAAALIARYRPV